MLMKTQYLCGASATRKTTVFEEWDFKRFDPFLNEITAKIPIDC